MEKYFNFGMEYKMYGIKSIKVPSHFTKEQAEKYVREHLDDISLPVNSFYVSNSATPNFNDSSFYIRKVEVDNDKSRRI